MKAVSLSPPAPRDRDLVQKRLDVACAKALAVSEQFASDDRTAAAALIASWAELDGRRAAEGAGGAAGGLERKVEELDRKCAEAEARASAHASESVRWQARAKELEAQADAAETARGGGGLTKHEGDELDAVAAQSRLGRQVRELEAQVVELDRKCAAAEARAAAAEDHAPDSLRWKTRVKELEAQVEERDRKCAEAEERASESVRWKTRVRELEAKAEERDRMCAAAEARASAHASESLRWQARAIELEEQADEAQPTVDASHAKAHGAHAGESKQGSGLRRSLAFTGILSPHGLVQSGVESGVSKLEKAAEYLRAKKLKLEKALFDVAASPQKSASQLVQEMGGVRTHATHARAQTQARKRKRAHARARTH